MSIYTIFIIICVHTFVLIHTRNSVHIAKQTGKPEVVAAKQSKPH